MYLCAYFFVHSFSYRRRIEMSPPSDLFAKQIIRKIFNNQNRMPNSKRVIRSFQLVLVLFATPDSHFLFVKLRSSLRKLKNNCKCYHILLKSKTISLCASIKAIFILGSIFASVCVFGSRIPFKKLYTLL